MGKNSRKAPERNSARLSAKRRNPAVESEAEEQVCPNDPKKQQEVEKKSEDEQQMCPDDQNQQQELVENLSNENALLEEIQPDKKKRKQRVLLNVNNKQLLDDLSKRLHYRSAGAAMNWFIPNETKGLYEMTNMLGNEKGGQTIDWLLSLKPHRISRLTQELGFQNVEQTFDWLFPGDTKRLIEVTREFGFTEIGQTIECLLGMATYKPLLELTNSLGFQDFRKTIEWLLNEAQPNIAAINQIDLPPALGSPLTPAQFASRYSSAVNKIPHGQFPLNQGGDTPFSSNPSMPVFNNRPSTQTLNFAHFKKPQSLVQNQSFGNHGVPDQMMPPNLHAPGNQFHVGETQGQHDQFRMVNSEPRQPFQFQNDTSSWLPENQSFGNHGVPHQMMPPNLNPTGNQFHVGKPQGHHDRSRMVNSEPGHPLQFQNGTSSWPRENPQQNQFQTNSTGLQGGFPLAENQLSMQQSIQGRSFPYYNYPIQGSNSNYIDPSIDVNSHALMPYPAQDSNDFMQRRMQAESTSQMPYPAAQDLNQGQHNMFNDFMQRRMQAESIGHQLQPQFSTEDSRRKPF